MPLPEGADSIPGATACTGGTFESLDPASGAVVGVFPVHDDAAVGDAVARAAADHWAALGFGERWLRLAAYRGHLARRLHELADPVHRENGKPHADALLEIALAVDHLAWAGAHAAGP
ncbi:aldehyde dehydrogenase family protein [Modestobacter sp. SYSU DS0875]